LAGQGNVLIMLRVAGMKPTWIGCSFGCIVRQCGWVVYYLLLHIFCSCLDYMNDLFCCLDIAEQVTYTFTVIYLLCYQSGIYRAAYEYYDTFYTPYPCFLMW